MSTGIEWEKDRDAAKLSMMHKTAPQNKKITWHQMPVMSRLRNP